MKENKDKYNIESVFFEIKYLLILLSKIKLQNPIKKTGDKFNKNRFDCGRLKSDAK